MNLKVVTVVKQNLFAWIIWTNSDVQSFKKKSINWWESPLNRLGKFDIELTEELIKSLQAQCNKNKCE